MAIRLYIGLPGSGKTTISAAHLFKAMRGKFKYRKKNYKEFKKKKYQYECFKGCEVWSNMPLYGANILDTDKDLMISNIERGLLIIDEAGLEYNNRDFKSFSKNALRFYKLHRHYELDVNFYSQDVDIDKKLVSLADTVYITERSMLPWFVYTKAIKRKLDVVDGQIVAVFSLVPWLLGGRTYYFAPKYWHLFDSWQRDELPEKEWQQWVFDEYIEEKEEKEQQDDYE